MGDLQKNKASKNNKNDNLTNSTVVMPFDISKRKINWKVQRVDRNGLLFLVFDYPIGRLLNKTDLSKIDTHLINITFNSRNFKAERKLQESAVLDSGLDAWTPVNITDDQFLIQLNFSNPLLISLFSQPLKDIIEVQINDTQLY